ncbi:hypothetical protein [Candidatus Alkanophaga liquidiphilum]
MALECLGRRLTSARVLSAATKSLYYVEIITVLVLKQIGDDVSVAASGGREEAHRRGESEMTRDVMHKV